MTGHPLIRAVKPLVEAIGATLIPIDELRDTDLVLSWKDESVVGVRISLEDALAGMIGTVEEELGGALPGLSREGKQAAIRMLDERGAFLLRKSIEDVADAMGVSRITIYNYLTAIREQPTRGERS
ncbi:MAG: helix-turn-helix domain-containing protein [Acidimicrobiia bacterium]|nr:helix-turn-helix domain-containing protein [Acidimicrobiia bacterium]